MRRRSPSPRHALLALPALLVALALASCGSDGGSPVGPPPTPPAPINLVRLLQSILPDGYPLPTDIDTTASLLVALQTPTGQLAAAGFISGGTSVNAGTVSVRALEGAVFDSSTLSVLSLPFEGRLVNLYVAIPPPTLPFDGITQHVWKASGAPQFPAFTDSVRSVEPADVTAPAPGAVVTRASGMAVTWSDAGADPAVQVVASVRSEVDTTRFALAAAADPAGTLTIPAGSLGGLPAGAARVTVARARLRGVTVSSRPVLLGVQSNAPSVAVTLQ